MAHCLVARFEEQVLRFALQPGEARLGSGPDCEIHLPFTGVSRLHAVVDCRQSGSTLRDQMSKNGLVVDGRRLSEVVLIPGMAVLVGAATVFLEDGPASDVELGLVFEMSRSPSGLERSDKETDEIGSTREVLRLIRDLESSKEKGAGAEEREERLSRGRRALGAETLFVFARGEESSVRILVIAGPEPGRRVLDWVSGRIKDSDGARGARAARIGGRAALVSIAPGRAGTGVAALFAQGSEPHPWQRDLLAFVCEHLTADLAVPSPGAKPGRMDSFPLTFPPGMVVGESSAVKGLLQQISKTVKSRLDVLLLGETGTGKELIAQTVHASGPTPDGPFIAINCAAIPHELLEAELFGIQSRVASGVDAHSGRFLEADGGTLFLDEIGEMAPSLQAKILRFLQEREVHPVGASRPTKVNLRVISASNRNLPEDVAAGRFRPDLYYRLRGLQFHIPPLRDRLEDIPALVSAFAQRAATENGKSFRGVSQKAVTLLMSYGWPGNVRELASEVERAVLVTSDGGILNAESFGPVSWAVRTGEEATVTAKQETLAPRGVPGRVAAVFGSPSASGHTPLLDTPPGLAAAVVRLEREMIKGALSATDGNKTRAAQLLGISRNGLILKIKRLLGSES